MSSSAAIMLLVCVVVCLGGKHISGFEKIRDAEQVGEENSVLSQILEELQRLTDADQMKTDEINNLKDEVKKNKEEIKNFKGADKKKTDEINHLKDADQKKTDEINQLKDQTTKSQAASVGNSAFMAVMDGGYHYPKTYDVILFDYVLLNLGEHYDAQTSIFTCAENGLYLFSVTLYSADIRYMTDNNRVSGVLMVDGVSVAEILSVTYDPDHDQYHQAAVTAVVECPQGGEVWVKSDWDSCKVYGRYYQPRTLFTGYAISYYVHP